MVTMIYKPIGKCGQAQTCIDACLRLPTFSTAVFIFRLGAKVMAYTDDDADSNVVNDVDDIC